MPRKLTALTIAVLCGFIASAHGEQKTQSLSANLLLNSGFESSVTYWMPLDGWLVWSVYDCPEALLRKPPIYSDGLGSV